MAWAPLHPRVSGPAVALTVAGLGACGGHLDSKAIADSIREGGTVGNDATTDGGAASAGNDATIDGATASSGSDAAVEGAAAVGGSDASIDESSHSGDGGCVLDAPTTDSDSSTCPNLCGNGRIDICNNVVDGGRGQSQEVCDGLDLGCQTCARVGYGGGGTLACYPGCSVLDVRGCEDCVAGTRVSCARPALTSNPDEIVLSLAASAAEVGLVWRDSAFTTHFTRLAPDFSVLSDTSLQVTAAVASSVAATPSGWLITTVGSSVSLISLDSAGTVVASRDVALLSTGADSDAPLVASATGLLLMWVDGLYGGWDGTLHAQVLAWDGSSVGPELQVAHSSGGYDYASVFVGDGFELAATVASCAGSQPIHGQGCPNGVNVSNTVQLVHMAMDGTARMDATVSGAHAPSLAWSGSETRLLYWTDSAPNQQSLLQRVTAGGVLVSNPISITFAPDRMLPTGALGSDMAMLRFVPTASTLGEDVVRVSVSGSTVWEVPVMQSPYQVPVVWAAQGSDGLIAWLDLANTLRPGLSLARVHLTP
jgi:hypothetical protein